MSERLYTLSNENAALQLPERMRPSVRAADCVTPR
jgi:hypothetical protein